MHTLKVKNNLRYFESRNAVCVSTFKVVFFERRKAVCFSTFKKETMFFCVYVYENKKTHFCRPMGLHICYAWGNLRPAAPSGRSAAAAAALSCGPAPAVSKPPLDTPGFGVQRVS